MDPHHFGNLDPHTDPHLHQLKIRIRIHQSDKLNPELDPDPHQGDKSNLDPGIRINVMQIRNTGSSVLVV
jgi:hypothetical protein